MQRAVSGRKTGPRLPAQRVRDLDTVAKVESCNAPNFGENSKRDEIVDSYSLSRATEVADEFSVRRRGPQISTRKPCLRSSEFLATGAKRLLQQYHLTSGHKPPSKDVRFVPKTDSAADQRAELFDHLVGAGEHRRRHVQAKVTSGLEIDYELEFG